MTIPELQEILSRNGVSLSYLGYGSGIGHGQRPTRKAAKLYACTIVPAKYSRWERDEFSIRGSGESMLEAIDDALFKLSVFLISRTKSPYEEDT